MNTIDFAQANANEWNKYVTDGYSTTVPIDHDTYQNAINGDWDISLFAPMPKDWFLPLQGAKVLGLASGGGQQCPIFVANGADVTVFDISSGQLAQEKKVADREGYHITLVQGDMTKNFPFDDESFDIIFHACSNCFVQDVLHIWKESYRVLKPNGVLVANFVNPFTFLFEDFNSEPLVVTRKLPVDPVADLSDIELAILASNDCIEFSHSLETQIAGQIRAGFILADLREGYDGRPGDILSKYAPSYISTKSIKPANKEV
jgi:SAM-dependent methyltransferase